MKKINIMIVDDSPADILLFEESISELDFIQDLEKKTSGKEAIGYLLNVLEDPSKTLPNLIFLDINIPVMDGHEILGILKSTEEFKHIPVIMLTTSKDEKDVMKAFKGYSSGYIVKPDDFLQMDVAVKKIKEYWMSASRLPS